MSELSKEGEIAEPTVEPEKKADEQPAGPEGKPEGEDESKKSLPIDYKAELEAERKRGFQDGAAYAAFKEREDKRKEEEEPKEPEGDDVPLTRAEYLKLRDTDRKEQQRSLVESEVNLLTSDPDRKALILEMHKNRGFPEGMSIRDQVEELFAATDRKRIIAENTELRRAAGKAPESFSPTHRDAPLLGETKLSTADAQAIKASGFVWDGKEGVYKKPLQGGKKFLYWNPKTKEKWSE